MHHIYQTRSLNQVNGKIQSKPKIGVHQYCKNHITPSVRDTNMKQSDTLRKGWLDARSHICHSTMRWFYYF